MKTSQKNNPSRMVTATVLVLLLLAPLSGWAQPEVNLEYTGQFGSQGTNLGRFSSPTGIAFRTAEQVIIADRGNSLMQICDLAGSCSQLGTSIAFFRNQPGTFDLPHGVAVNPAGQIAVADEDNHAVQLCNIESDCLYKGALNTENNPPSQALGRWAFPGDVAFDSQGRVFGLDSGNDRVQVMRGDDLFVVRVLMQPGSGRGRISGAKGMDIDADDNMIFADTGNHRVQICDFNESCTVFGSEGGAVGQFRSPEGLEVDSQGRIWVADTGNDRIQVCDYDGNCVAFGRSGSGNFQFNQPTDVAVHPGGNVAVVDSANHRIQLFSTEAGFVINEGVNDAWFNPTTPGQGFFITYWPGLSKLFVAHFTFDAQAADPLATAVVGGPNQRWVTAIGDVNANSAVLSAELTRGGLFDMLAPGQEQVQGYGSYTVTFDDCSAATIAYSFPDLGLQGTIPVVRIVQDNEALCEALMP